MCIVNDDYVVVKNGPLKLWKIIRKDDVIGIWGETGRGNEGQETFKIGDNYPHDYPLPFGGRCLGQFHCFFTRKDARSYRKTHQNRAGQWGDGDPMGHTKIIQVFANSNKVVSVGQDKETNINAVSVFKMTIKNLKHQR